MASATVNFVFMIATFFTGTNAPGEGGPLLANGQRYQQKDMMFAAHRTLPFGQLVNVCTSRKCIIVTIKDRGPYLPKMDIERRIDLSTVAAKELGMSGRQRVKVYTPLPQERPAVKIMYGEEHERETESQIALK